MRQIAENKRNNDFINIIFPPVKTYGRTCYFFFVNYNYTT